MRMRLYSLYNNLFYYLFFIAEKEKFNLLIYKSRFIVPLKHISKIMENKSNKDQLKYLIDLANRTINSKYSETGTVPRQRVNQELFAELRSGGLTLILKVVSDKHPLFVDYDTQVKGSFLSDAQKALGILNGLKIELENANG